MKIRYTLPALADLDSILTYISRTSPQAAARVQKRIQDVIGLLLTHPEIGLRTDDPNVRRLTTTPDPFLVFYEIGSQEIIIHAIRHGARDPGEMPGKRDSAYVTPAMNAASASRSAAGMVRPSLERRHRMSSGKRAHSRAMR